VGLAGAPDDPAAYVAFVAEGARIYLAPEVWKEAAGNDGRLCVRMPGYGEARFRFELPRAGAAQGAGTRSPSVEDT
jgi:hypothetical protein